MLAKYFLSVVLLIPAFQALAWNALGHQLIGQIAYDNLTPKARQNITQSNKLLNRWGRQQSIPGVASWMDTLRINHDLWLEESHYINLPFSNDNSPLPAPKKLNILVALGYSQAYLSLSRERTFPAVYLTGQSRNAAAFLTLKKIKSSRKTGTDNRALIYELLHNPAPSLQKAFCIRLLFHLIGDLHQPLHTVSYFDKSHKEGDRGGNMYFLHGNPIAKNLHAYWDNGGGLLKPQKKMNKRNLKAWAKRIEKRYLCDWKTTRFEPEVWVLESRALAMSKAYHIKSPHRLDKAYQMEVKAITEKQIAIAGCRLAGVLNRL